MAALLLLCMAGTAVAATATNDEYAMLVLANELRAEPRKAGVGRAAVGPLAWNDQLAAGARVHSDDMLAHGCFTHNSCNGESWVTRISRYFSSWSVIGENLGYLYATVDDVQQAWINSPGHLNNLMLPDFRLFGGGISASSSKGPYYTEDFADGGLVSIPTIPAAAVLPRLGGTEQRELLMNHVSSSSAAPSAVHAMLGSKCVALSLAAGTTKFGTYRAVSPVPGGGCVPLVFEVVEADGARARFPDTGAILVGTGSTCAERTTALPTADCGGGPVPTPSPTPVGTGGTAELQRLRVYLRAGIDDPGNGRIQATAVMPDIPGFDPAGAAGTVSVAFGDGQRWSADLPASCGASPCLVALDGGLGFRARYAASGPGLTFVRREGGGWKMFFWTHGAPLAGLSQGSVTMTIALGGTTLEGTATGDLRGRTLIAR